MTLMRFDPFRELDRLAEQTFSAGARALRSMPMEALRRGDNFIVNLDLPGVRREDIDLTVERNVVSVRARREPMREEGDEVIIDERFYGEFARQLFLGENLDPDGLSADLMDGVLTLTIPVREESKPRKVRLGTTDTSTDTSMETSTTGDGATSSPATDRDTSAATEQNTAAATERSSTV
jgi:HSP20 family protein